jgi:2,5-furandicarboxylate decarboxylase 1
VHDDLLVTKIGMVAATRPGDGTPNSRSEFALPPEDVMMKVRKALAEY